MQKFALFSRRIEHLESRIAPASLVTVTNHKVATWIDLDGDKVTLTASIPVLDEANFTFLDPLTDGGHQLALLDLHDEGALAKGVKLTFTAARDRVAHAGDGSVNIGRIDATGIDLGAVSIPGDLASITAGDTTLTTFSVAKITVGSAGAFGLETQGAQLGGVATNNEWIFTGKTGPVAIKTSLFSSIDVQNGNGTVDFDVTCTLASVTIGGDLVGGDDSLRGSDGVGSGYLFSEGPMGAVKIAGGIVGGTKQFGGSVTSASSIASVTTGHNVTGGTATGTGLIFASGPLGNVTIGGSLIGGTSPVTAGAITTVIDSAGAIGSSFNTGGITITHDLVPGTGTFCGAIYTVPGSTASLKSVTIGGILYGFDTLAIDATTTQHVVNGIYSDAQIGPIKIGAISGNSPSSPAQIIAHGEVSPPSVKDATAIASLTVARGAYSVRILAGYNSLNVADNPDVQIGAVKIGGDFIGSGIAVGTTQAGKGIGDVNNAIATPPTGITDSASIVAKIASLTVGGYVNGNPFHTANFTSGVVAQDIGAVKIGATAIELMPTFRGGPLDLFAFRSDFFVREVLQP